MLSGKERIKQLIAGYTRHAFVLALCWLVLCVLRKKGGQTCCEKQVG